MNFSFFVEYLKNLRSVGAIAPSSRYLARRIAGEIDFQNAQVIVELGAGTGAFTRELIRRLNPQARLLVVENNPVFYRRLQQDYGALLNVYIAHASAESLTDLLRNYTLPEQVDYIVSGLPFASLPGAVSRDILAAAQKHTKHGKFITFQYTLLKKPLFEAYFSHITTTRELRNLPPAYVLRAKN